MIFLISNKKESEALLTILTQAVEDAKDHRIPVEVEMCEKLRDRLEDRITKQVKK